MTEILPVAPAVAFQNALQDSTMLEPLNASLGTGTNPLFPITIFTMRQEGEGSANNGDPTQFQSPPNTVMLVFSTPYGKRASYMDNTEQEDWLLSVRIRIIGRTGADIADTQSRLQFAMQKRQQVFSGYNIMEIGIDEHPRMRPVDKIGFISMDYTVRFRYALQS